MFEKPSMAVSIKRSFESTRLRGGSYVRCGERRSKNPDIDTGFEAVQDHVNGPLTGAIDVPMVAGTGFEPVTFGL